MNKSLNENRNGNGHTAQELSCQASKETPQTRTTVSEFAIKENQVAFQTSDGIELAGVPLRVTHYSIVFELYNAVVTPRLSESLIDFKVNIQAQVVYSGHAIVRNVISTETKVVCEVALKGDDWKDSNLALALQRGGAGKEFKTFLNGWQTFHQISPSFKVAALNLFTFFSEAQIWLDRIDSAIRNLPMKDQPDLERKTIQELDPLFTAATRNINEYFEDTLNHVEADFLPAHQAFCRRLLHSVTQCSPFMHRAFDKPLGYAGDHEMVSMMFRSPFEGESLFAKMLNSYALQLPPIIGHRNRIYYLHDKLEKESLRMMAHGKNIHVFNIGCGPAQEVQRFLAKGKFADHAHFTLADFDDGTVANTNSVLSELQRQHGRRGKINVIKRSVQQLLKQTEKNFKYTSDNQYDLVYCAGLFDYLTDQVCAQLMDVFYAMLRPGGLLIITNVDNHSARHQMECFLDWHLVYRNAETVKTLAPKKAKPQDVSIKYDPSGVNVFMEIRKPDV